MTVYKVHVYKISRNTDTLMVCVIVTTDNTTTAGINYKELYNCKWDATTMTNNTLYTPSLKFYKYFGLIMACIGRN